jgi:tripartite-type tricarboxylate transporter receptor subunit TctC
VEHRPYGLVVHPSVSAKDLGELATLVRQQPGKLTYATSSSGTLPHVVY